ncbi:MAG: methylenetetrahydrofolate--tRNA-(uracil(54)-C(5))-methyltransferase (FADH(2)-oxidizing) TrmFO [Bacillota bacterium]
MQEVMVIGAGLAGSEAAWQLSSQGIKVKLFEMRPEVKSPAHHTDLPAELVCSNSFRADGLANAAGLLKEEMRQLDSLIMAAADANSLPAGRALAVDREEFSRDVKARLEANENIEIIRKEVTEIPEDKPVVIATGPLTSDKMAEAIKELTGEDYLYFYDAAAPIVTAESINYDVVFKASRYDEGTGDYLNAPMNEEEFFEFWDFLLRAEVNLPREFEEDAYFEACLPIEVMAKRGRKTLLYGPLKPVGLKDPRTGKKPQAVVQLRQDNKEGSLYNLVGFQTRLKWGEQDKMLKFIPGLEDAEIVRHGVMHRNTYLNSPLFLKPTYQFKDNPNIFFAGQITGVEGYIESTSSGLIAGINAARMVNGKTEIIFPEETAMGALPKYITDEYKVDFKPMKINFGLLPDLDEVIKDKRERNLKRSEVALERLKSIKNKYNI